MVRAIREDRKGQTRRGVTRLSGFGSITEFGQSDTPGYAWTFRDRRACWNDLRHEELLAACPYGKPGDRLWIRENFRVSAGDAGYDHGVQEGGDHDFAAGWAEVEYQAGGRQTFHDLDDEADNQAERFAGCDWKPSIHLPRWACRQLLELTDVRVQRLQDISQEDAMAEGVQDRPPNGRGDGGTWESYSPGVRYVLSPKESFQGLWTSIHGAASWNENPWLWALSFKKIEA